MFKIAPPILLTYSRYWYITTSGLNQSESEKVCQTLHPMMQLAELTEPGEYEAVISNFILQPPVYRKCFKGPAGVQ